MNQPTSDLPPQFVERLREIVGEESCEACLYHASREHPVSFRANTLKTTVAEVNETLRVAGIETRTVDWLPTALVIPANQREPLIASDLFSSGQIYIQNLSSMLAPWLLDPQPGETVLDLAAAPGGKATQIAALMENTGLLSVVEPIRNRFFKLREVLKLQGVTIAKLYQMDGRSVGTKVPERFDRVLLDAPCSSEARIRRDDPASWEYWSERKIAEQSRKQKGLIRSALRALKVGGRLVYATCSYAPEENEAVIHEAIRRCGSAIEVLSIELPMPYVLPGLSEWRGRAFDPQVQFARRVLPHDAFDGFFLCAIKKIAPID
jgi:16S rRNA (cytosine1407-C5)-methyltransferase